jgi:hypothetical protein
MIPRLLHQTFRSSRPLAPQLEACLETNQRLNPDWTHTYYDDKTTEEVVEAQLGAAFLELYRRIDPHYGAAKADIFRYACIYAFGGCYLDIKSICTRPLSTVLKDTDECILSHWDTERYPGFGLHREIEGGREFQQWYILASARNPLVEAALWRAKSNLERYSYLRDKYGQMAVLRTTGPIAFSLSVAPLLKAYPHRIVDSWNDLGLEYEGFSSLKVRVELTGENYRDGVRPLIIPRAIPIRLYPLYFGLSDAVTVQLRRMLRTYRTMSKRA